MNTNTMKHNNTHFTRRRLATQILNEPTPMPNNNKSDAESLATMKIRGSRCRFENSERVFTIAEEIQLFRRSFPNHHKADVGEVLRKL